MNEIIKTVFGEDSITFDEFCERLDGVSLNEIFVDKADFDLLKDSYDELKEQTANFDPDWEIKARKIIFDGTLDYTLKSTDVRDIKLIKKLLDFDKLEYDNGAIIGLDEQLESLKAEHEYLFKASEPVPSFSRASGSSKQENTVNSKNQQTNSVFRAVFGRK